MSRENRRESIANVRWRDCAGERCVVGKATVFTNRTVKSRLLLTMAVVRGTATMSFKSRGMP